jgi:hypothetical protein
MTQSEMVELVTKLYDCSVLMREIDSETSNALLEMSNALLSELEKRSMPPETNDEIEQIYAELSDD